jgi:hypothetical protein
VAKAGQQARPPAACKLVPPNAARMVGRGHDAFNLECVDRSKNAEKSPPCSSPRPNAAGADALASGAPNRRGQFEQTKVARREAFRLGMPSPGRRRASTTGARLLVEEPLFVTVAVAHHA